MELWEFQMLERLEFWEWLGLQMVGVVLEVQCLESVGLSRLEIEEFLKAILELEDLELILVEPAVEFGEFRQRVEPAVEFGEFLKLNSELEV